jgi:nucleotide-binding universal stress UspA family protein
MKILLAVDGSPCSDLAIEEVGRRPWPDGSQIKIISAFEIPVAATPEGWTLPPSYFDEMQLAIHKQAKSIVDAALNKLKSNKTLTIDGQFLPGSPKSVILDVAEGWGADLIVLGSHGYRAWERFLLGSVSQSVVSHAKCSVEVVRCRNNPESSK